MAVPLSEVGRRGKINLTFAPQSGKTIIRDVYYEIPFKITRILHSHPSDIAHLILMQCAPGLIGGDQVECTIHVRSGARVLITSQAATKVHPSCGKVAIQNTKIRVDAGGELRLHYDPVIPFSGARLRQVTSIDLEPGARLSYWESLMAGRIGRGEAWQFDEVSSETCLRMNGRLLYADRFRLRPASVSPASDWMMGRATYLATGLRFDESDQEFCLRLHDLLPQAGVDNPAAGLTAVRVALSDGPEFYRYGKAFASLADSPTHQIFNGRGGAPCSTN